MAVQERSGVFRKYPKKEPLEVVGFIPCGGCPGERLERAPAEMKKYGAEEIVLASCFLAGYPPCPYLEPLVDDPAASDRYDSTRPGFPALSSR